MKTPLLLLSAILLGFSSCKKDETPAILPKAGFTVDGFNALSSSPDTLKMGPYDLATLSNTSENADSYLWDFGNGTTSKEKTTILQYPSAGIYTLTLTVTTKQGQTAVAKKVVKVVQPVLTQLVISKLNLNSTVDRPKSLPPFARANVWVELVKGEPNQYYTTLPNGANTAPVIYKSSIATNVDSTDVPLKFAIPQRIVMDIPTLVRDYGYKGVGYGINLYAQDATGTYLLFSTFWSGGSMLYRGPDTYANPYASGTFEILSGFLGFSLRFEGKYE